MSKIKFLDIAGVNISKGTYCINCMGNLSDYTEKEIILRSEEEDGDCVYWCDSCQKLFKGWGSI